MHLPRHRAAVAASMLTVAALGTGIAFAATGDQDPDFNGGAARVVDFPDSYWDDVNQIAVAPDGSIYLAGRSCFDGCGISLARLSTAGQPVTTFGEDGALTDYGIEGLQSAPMALAFSTDDDLLVGVSTFSYGPTQRAKTWGTGDDGADGDFTVLRYDPDGTRIGESRIDLGNVTEATIAAIVPQPGGGALVIGSVRPVESAGREFVRVLLDADGQLDTSFGDGGSGIAIDSALGGAAFAGGHQAGGPAGSVVLAGLDSSGGQFVLRRYLGDGSTDDTYGGTFPAPADADMTAGAVAPDGRVYGVNAQDQTIVRFTAAGQPDATWDGVGAALFADPAHTFIQQVRAQADGKLIVVALDNHDGDRVVAARLNADGTLDTTFGQGGITTLPRPEGVADMEPGALTIQPDGKAVIGGDASNGPRLDRARALSINGGVNGFAVRLGGDPVAPADTTTTDTTTTTTQTTTTTTTTTTAPKPVAAASTNPLPVARSCVSRRSFKIRLRIPRGVTPTRATVKVNGKKIKVVSGSRLRAAIDLRGLPKGKATVAIVVDLAGGKAPLTGSRTYHTCVPKKSGSIPKL